MGKKHLLSGLSVFVSIFLYISCADVEYFQETNRNVTPQLSLSESTIVLEENTLDTIIDVRSNMAWQAVSDQDWCVASPPSNQGNSRLLLRLKPNSSIEARTATVTITVNQELERILTVKQPGTPLLSYKNLTLGVAHEDTDLQIAAVGTWSISVTDGADWCSLSATSGSDISTIQIIVSTNNTGSARNASIKAYCGEVEGILNITQSATMDNPEAILADGNNFLLSWNSVLGAASYQIKVDKTSGGTLGTYSVSKTTTSYSFINDAGNILNGYNGGINIQVIAITKDPAVSGVASPITAHSLYALGSGNGSTAETAYLVSCARHLSNVRANPAGYFKQINDIDLSDFDDDNDASNGNFTPINTFKGVYTGEPATGTFAKIQNPIIRISNSSSSAVGIFAVTEGTSASPVVIQNIALVNPVMDCSTSATIISLGALIGDAKANTKVNFCSVSGGSINSDKNKVGGLIANSAITGAGMLKITDSFNDNCSVSGGNNVGGILANGNADITNCYNTGNITGNAYAGGIGGTMDNYSVIRYSYNKGIITTRNNNESPVGGIAGRLMGANGASVHYCYNTGAIKAQHASNTGGSGGIAGKANNANCLISNCYNTGEINTTSTMGSGGIVGLYVSANNASNNIVYCYNTGNIVAPSNAGGGIAGEIRTGTQSTVVSCFFLKTASINTDIPGVRTGMANNALAKNPAELQSQDTFTGWDFDQEWIINTSSGYLYPQLKKVP